VAGRPAPRLRGRPSRAGRDHRRHRRPVRRVPGPRRSGVPRGLGVFPDL